MLYSYCCSPWLYIDAVRGKNRVPREKAVGDGVLNLSVNTSGRQIVPGEDLFNFCSHCPGRT